jgi:hypothetical protein
MEIAVLPTKSNAQYDLVASATAHCWILENIPSNAYRKVCFNIEKFDWEIKETVLIPTEVTANDFQDADIGLDNYNKTQEEGMAIVYIGVSRDGKTEKGPIELTLYYEVTVSEYLKIIKENRNKGRCLHFEAGDRCNRSINAHSIQNKGLLARIAEKGHVFGLSTDYGSIKKNKGKPEYKKIGINNISTFKGFCQIHDNELFEPIDNHHLIPTEQQVFLYAYRSLCRELFVKENSLNSIRKHLSNGIEQKRIKEYFSDLEIGTKVGFDNLLKHKAEYDLVFKNNSFHKINYVIFTSNNEPNIAFSGVIYPDYDYIGNRLQDLGDLGANLKLITFCSAPMEKGWGFIFAWHESSSNICISYMRSLATAIHDTGGPTDFLFRLVVNCENHAISPRWWENIPDESRNRIIEKISETVDTFSEIPSTYLTHGLEGISDWKFDGVKSNTNLKN